MLKRTRVKRAAAQAELNDIAGLYGSGGAGKMEVESATERTHNQSQGAIREEVSAAAKTKSWRLRQEGGPWGIRCSRNGRFGLGYSGERTMMLDLETRQVKSELVLRGEEIKAATFLQDESNMALAQKKYVYIYETRTGAEIHRLSDHLEPEHLEFLPYHMLLASMGHSGYLKYIDISMGKPISQHRAGPTACVVQNSQTAVLAAGQKNGIISFWSPAQATPLAKLLCHRGSLASVSFSLDGNYFATAGLVDAQIKLWDARTFKQLGATLSRPSRPTLGLNLSQQGLLAIISTSGLDVFDTTKNANSPSLPRSFEPYILHRPTDGSWRASLSSCFRPFEDVLLVGHESGLDSILVPGAGAPNYDSLEGQSPFAPTTARRRALVTQLLDKLPPESIDLKGDEFIGKLAADPTVLQQDRQAILDQANQDSSKTSVKSKRKARGRSKLAAKLRKKAKNVISLETVKLRQKRQQQIEEKQKKSTRDAARRSKKQRKQSVADALLQSTATRGGGGGGGKATRSSSKEEDTPLARLFS